VTVWALVFHCGIDISHAEAAMDQDEFWSMIEIARQASGGDVEQQAAALKSQLRRLPLDEVIGFQQFLEELQAESFSVELWGAAEAIVDKVSEDHFFGFRGWLIGQGQGTYQAAIADPDSLADLPELRAGEGMLAWGEAMWFVAAEVHQERTGGELPPEAIWRSTDQRPILRCQGVRPSCRPAFGSLLTRQVVAEDWPHPPVEVAATAAMPEPAWSSPAVPSACP
jgi:Protein of unknown function (DUF4240)